MNFQIRFVEFLPEELESNVLYVSVEYSTVIHKCPCGCGEEVNTPLSPTGWKIIYNGETITLDPSVGNWSLNCKSHYWIINSNIIWSDKWSDEKIQYTRQIEKSERENFYCAAKDGNSFLEASETNILPKKKWFHKLIFWKQE